MRIGIHATCLLFLSNFQKNAPMSNSIKIRPVGEELFHADRRTDRAKLIVDFRILVSFLENGYKHSNNCKCIKI